MDGTSPPEIVCSDWSTAGLGQEGYGDGWEVVASHLQTGPYQQSGGLEPR